MRRICFFSGDITRSGGTERAAVMLANRLAESGEYEVVFLSLVEGEGEPFFSVSDRIARFVLGDRWLRPGPGYLKLIPMVRRFFKGHRTDAVIDIDIVLDSLSIPAARGLDTKVVSWEHSNCEFERSVWYRRAILNYSVKRSDYIVTLTESDRRSYIERLGRRKAISAIPNPMEVPRDSGGEEKKKQLITVCRLAPEKGIDLLAELAGRLLPEHEDWKWLVLGEGELRPLLERTVEEKGLEGRLVLAGQVSGVEKYLRESEIFVLTSRREGLPMCLLEAKACRLPCVSFDIRTGPSEIIRNGENGFLIEPFDCGELAGKLELLMENEALRGEFAEKSCLDAEKFRMENILEQWKQVLGQLCG